MSLSARDSRLSLASPQTAPRRRLCVVPRELRLAAEAGGVVVVSVHGGFEADTARSVEARVRALLLKAHRRVALDFDGVAALDRASIAHVVRLYENVRAARARLTLVNVSDELRAQLEGRGLGHMIS